MADGMHRNQECAHLILDYILENWAEDPATGLEAVMTGSQDTPEVTAPETGDAPGNAPFWSVKAWQTDYLMLLLGALIADLEKTGLYELWTSGGPDFDRDVARALWKLGADQKGAFVKSFAEPKLSAQATAMAQVIARFQELARKLQVQFLPQEQYPGALVSQCHDPLRLRRAGKAAWIAFIQPLIDASRLQDRGDSQAVLEEAWEAILKEGSVDFALRFKDADGWTEYNQRFGLGNLREAVVAGLERAARSAGMHEVFGTDPESILEGMLFALGKHGMSIGREEVNRLYVILRGLRPVRPLGVLPPVLELDVAEVAVAEMIELGSALFPEPEDLPALSVDVPFRNTTLFRAIDADLIALAQGSGITSPAQKTLFAGAVSVFCRGFPAHLVEDFEACDSPPGRATELLRRFLKLNVFNWWRMATRRSAFLALRMLVSRAIKRHGFQDLDPAFAAALAHHGMTEQGWDAQRSAGGVIKAPHSEASMNAGTDALDRYLWGRLMFIMLEPDASNHAALGHGVADLTAEGELLRFMAQFREFRVPVPPKPLANPSGDSETDRAMRYALAGGDVLSGTVICLIWLLLLERLEAFAAAVEQGEAPSGDARPWFDTALKAGTLGLCTDFLFGEVTEMKIMPLNGYATIRNAAITAAVPIWQDARYGEDVRAALADWAEKEGAEDALDTLQVVRQALNFALRHQLQDMMAPGYLPRTLKDMQVRAAEGYWRMPGASGSGPRHN